MLLFAIFYLSVLVSSDIQISLSPSSLQYSGQSVNVSWTGYSNAFSDDLLTFYAPSSNQDADYLGYFPLTTSPTWRSGSGSIVVPGVVNLRVPYQFRILQHGRSAVATSPLLGYAVVDEPLQIHLAGLPDPSRIRVMWVTNSTSSPVVEYRQGATTQRAYGNSTTYTIDDMCGSPANDTSFFLSPGLIHDVVLTGLKPNSAFTYRVSNTGSPWSRWINARTSLPGGNADQPTRMLIFGDLGVMPPFPTTAEVQPPSKPNVDFMAKRVTSDMTYAAALHTGDISYARGLAWLWSYYFAQLEPLASVLPYYVGIGNHEYDCSPCDTDQWDPEWSNFGTDSGGECGVPYDTYHHMPDVPGGVRNFYYNFEVGLVHVVVMSSETEFLPGSYQLAFVEDALSKVDRRRTPWSVLTLHRPLYTSTQLMSEAGLNGYLRDSVEPIVQKYGVDLVLQHHIHQYERSCWGMDNFTCSDADQKSMVGPVYLTVGMAGNDYQSPWIMADQGHFPVPDWITFRSDYFGYATLQADAKKMSFAYYGFNNDQVHDTFEIHRRF